VSPTPSARHAAARLDQALVDRGLVPTRAKAQALILAGRVRRAGMVVDKPGTRVLPTDELNVDGAIRDVGRGAVKLRGALADFGVRAEGRDAIDVGASTGGFTQALLEAGARTVIALDVGRGQLDWALRNDPRVAVLEGINARHLEPAMLPVTPDLAVVDVSFISLTLVLPAVSRVLAPVAEIVALVKPQFEVGRGAVGRGGIVREPELHRQVVTRVAVHAREIGWAVLGVAACALRGATGNREFFLHLGRGIANPLPDVTGAIGAAVRASEDLP